MNNSISISGSTYTVTGTVKNKVDEKPILGLNVSVYDKDLIKLSDDYLGASTTDGEGKFTVTFDKKDFQDFFSPESSPDLYFIVKKGQNELVNTRGNDIDDANESVEPIVIWVEDFDNMEPGAGTVPALGWVGGFAQSNPDFTLAEPNLTSLDLLDNMKNIKELERQQKVLWPEFSWETNPGDPESRCYQMFAPDISRVGYTNEGKIYSIICPQQGANIPGIGSVNVEVTVTGNRGWVDESNKTIAADIEVEGKIWFSPDSAQNKFIKPIWDKFSESNLPFPSDKKNAIRVSTYAPNKPTQSWFTGVTGETKDFKIPEFAKHPNAWNVANLSVGIGPVVKADPPSKIVDEFNQLIVDVFNIVTGQMLQDGNVLTWNVWFVAPQHVEQDEWQTHADKWRESINADHGSPLGESSTAKYFNGEDFNPFSTAAILEIGNIASKMKDYLSSKLA